MGLCCRSTLLFVFIVQAMACAPVEDSGAAQANPREPQGPQAVRLDLARYLGVLGESREHLCAALFVAAADCSVAVQLGQRPPILRRSVQLDTVVGEVIFDEAERVLELNLSLPVGDAASSRRLRQRVEAQLGPALARREQFSAQFAVGQAAANLSASQQGDGERWELRVMAHSERTSDGAARGMLLGTLREQALVQLEALGLSYNARDTTDGAEQLFLRSATGNGRLTLREGRVVELNLQERALTRPELDLRFRGLLEHFGAVGQVSHGRSLDWSMAQGLLTLTLVELQQPAQPTHARFLARLQLSVRDSERPTSGLTTLSF